jgi:hypothetical protein
VPNCLQFARHNQPPNLVICWAVNEVILSADDLKTCTADFRFNQIWAQFMMFRLRLTRPHGTGSGASIDNDQAPARFQRVGQVVQD